MDNQHDDDLPTDDDAIDNPSGADTALVLANPTAAGAIDKLFGGAGNGGVVGTIKGGVRTLVSAVPAGVGFVGANYIREMASWPLIERLPADWQGRNANLLVDTSVQIVGAGLAKRLLGKKFGPAVAMGMVLNAVLHVIASFLGPESDVPVDLVALPDDEYAGPLPGEEGGPGDYPEYEEPPEDMGRIYAGRPGMGYGARPIPTVSRVYAQR